MKSFISRRKRIASLFVAIVTMTALLGGCGASESNTPTSGSPIANSGATGTEAKTVTFPLAEPLTLSCYVNVPSNITLYLQSLNDHPVYKQREKDTNIHLDFVTTEFSVLVASNSLPDMFIEFGDYPGGSEKAIQDGVLVDLQDYMKYAPNYSAIMAAYPEIAKELVLDSGAISGFSTIQLAREIPWWGPLVNKTMLDKLNLEVPETINDWYKC